MKAFLAINAGSSSIKAAVFEKENGLKEKLRASLHFEKKKAFAVIDGKSFFFGENRKKAILKFCLALQERASMAFISQRVVHGGKKFIEPVKITPAVLNKIKELKEIAPLHNSAFLELFEISKDVFQKVPQFACFDTAFHQTMPEALKTYPIPESWRKEGIERFGFHGISHEWCYKKAMEMTCFKKRPKVITCHIGAGVSFTAINEGKSIYNTMGFTPLEGAMMATRSGSIDPGILLYLLESNKVSLKELSDSLNKKSGLFALFGSADMTKVMQKAETNKKAALAYECFILSVCREIGSLIALLNGVDILCFTGGIGENAVDFREKVASQFSYMGLVIDKKANAQGSFDRKIHKSRSKCQVLVIYANEELAMVEKILF